MIDGSPDEAPVVIIGAGVAGLVAANTLITQHNLSPQQILLLEAQDRIGGRILTTTVGKEKTIPFDVGAAWFHGLEDHPFIPLAEQHNLKLKNISSRNPWLHPEPLSYTIFERQKTLDVLQIKKGWSYCALLLKELQKKALTSDPTAKEQVGPVLDEILMTDPFRSLKPVFAQILHLGIQLIQVWMGGSIKNLQLIEFREIDLMGEDFGPHAVVPKGMSQFIEILASPLKDRIKTGFHVQSIDYEQETIQITSTTGEIVGCQTSIITVSLGALQAHKISFRPELPPEKQQALKKFKMGQYKKVFLEFPYDFWSSDAPTPFIARLHSSHFSLIQNGKVFKGINALEGVCVGDAALELAQLEDTEIINLLLQELEQIFGEDIPTPISYFITKWENDPYSVGAYTHLISESTEKDFLELVAPVNNQLFFAGEATDWEYQGSLQAAYLSGIRVAEEVSDILTQ